MARSVRARRFRLSLEALAEKLTSRPCEDGVADLLKCYLRSTWRSILSWAALIWAVTRSALARFSGSENRSGW